jgi:hypothetical protein
VDTVLETGAQIAQSHARAEKLSLISQWAWWNPGLRQGSVAQKDRQAFCVERIRLVGLAHALLGLHRVRQMRESHAYWLRAVGLWVLLMAAETLQGLWRVKVLAPWVGDDFVKDVGVFTGSLIILLITFACIGWILSRRAWTLLLVGLTWVLLTIGYELALGRWAFDRTWSELAADFDLLHGQLLPLGLLLLLFAPLLAAWLRGRIGSPVRRMADRRV